MLRELVEGAPIVTAALTEAWRFESRAAALAVAVGLPTDRVPLVPLEVEVSGPRQFRGQPVAGGVPVSSARAQMGGEVPLAESSGTSGSGPGSDIGSALWP